MSPYISIQLFVLVNVTACTIVPVPFPMFECVLPTRILPLYQVTCCMFQSTLQVFRAATIAVCECVFLLTTMTDSNHKVFYV